MKKIYLGILMLFFIVSFTKAQPSEGVLQSDSSNYPHYLTMMQDPNANFFATQRAFENFFANKTRSKGDGYKVFKRWESFMESRVNADGIKPTPNAVWDAYHGFVSQYPQLSTNGSWSELGPQTVPTNGTGQPNGVGRVNAVAFHPTNSNIIWVGAPAGGLWKTINGGTSWTSSTDQLPTLGVSAIVVNPTNPNILYLGSGDRDGGDAPGMGVLKSTNGGTNWTLSNSGMGNRTVGGIIMDPSNSAVLYAATSGGIYKSSNSASTWTKISITANFKDIRFKPGTSSTLYASAAGSFYRSTNSGSTWTVITSGLPSSGRLVIGVSPASSSYVYAVVGSSSGFTGCYRSTNSGLSFTSMSTTPNILGYSATGNDTKSQSYYDLCIAVSPTNASLIHVGGINVWKSTNGGSSWTINAHWVGTSAPAVHADHHVLEYSPVNSALYLGNDGGFYKTTNAGTSWSDITSNLAISQIYKIGQSKASKNLVINGYQDNGTALYKNGSWTTEIGGDGMECIADPLDSNYFYGSLYYGAIRRSTNYGVSFYSIAGDGVNGINESGAWVTPFCLQEGNNNTMFAGYENVWRSTNVKASSSSSILWTKISTFGTSALRVIENSPANSQIIYAARFSSLWRSDNANAATPTWTAYSLPASVADIEAHPTNSNIVYMTGGNNIYKSTNKGANWTDISANLPNISMNCLVYDSSSSDGIFVGTDAGVYYRDGSMTNWVLFSNGLPASAEVTELEIFYDVNRMNSKLRGATYGRGLWSSDLYGSSNVAPVADFFADDTSPCSGSIIQLTDISTSLVSQRHWVITPNTFTYKYNTTDSSQVCYIQLNDTLPYTVKLVVSNTFGSDSLMKVNYINPFSGKTISYLQNFESFGVGSSNSTTINSGTLLDGWQTDNSGTFSWVVNSGPTLSPSTGPLGDHTYGNTVGKYIYTEASNPSADGEIARLVSPCVQIPTSGSYSMEFYYHMFGPGILALNVEVYSNGTWVNIWSKSGQQQTAMSSPYIKANVNLDAYKGTTIKVRFINVRPSGTDYFTSDIAIDDVRFMLAGMPIVNFSESNTDVCSGGVLHFNDQSSGNPTSWNWVFTPATVTYVNGTTSASQNPSVKFNGTGNYTVKLVATNSTGSDSITKSNYINSNSGNSLPFTENFESFTSGNTTTLSNGWTQTMYSTFVWTVNSSGTLSGSTGPASDHTYSTSSGKYLFTEASGSATGALAEIISPCIDMGSSNYALLTFWYHMYGADMGDLYVDVQSNGSWQTVDTIFGQQHLSSASPWSQRTINLNGYNGSTIKLRFKGIRGAQYTSDIAIDDVQIVALSAPANDEPCSATLMTTGTSCNYQSGTTQLASATQGVSTPSCGNYQGADVWFKTVIPSSGAIVIQADTINGGVIDGAMTVYTGTCNSLVFVECDDDDGVGVSPKVNLTGLVAGDTLYIRYWAYNNNSSGPFRICSYEPPHFSITPATQNVNASLGNVTLNIQASGSWSLTDNATWLTLSPTMGTGNATVTASYTSNVGGNRTAIITATPSGLSTVTATINQLTTVLADFNFSTALVCPNTSVVFTNASINTTSSQWFVNGTLAGSSTNLTYSFVTPGSYTIQLKASGGSSLDSISKVLVVSSAPVAHAGNDTSICVGEDLLLNGQQGFGLYVCTLGCAIPTNYCASASTNDNFEYISKVSLNGSDHLSTNLGNGYEDYSATTLTTLTKDSTYTIQVTATVPGATAYTEYIEVFIDWNRNGLFDEASISLGSASIAGSQVLSNVLLVPSTAVLGKTKMRIIQKYNGAVVSGCENNYGYGETEDYMIEISSVAELGYAWTGPQSYSSANRTNTINNVTTSQAGNYTYTVMNGVGCSSSDVKTVSVNPLPSITFAAIPSICVDASSIVLNQASPSGGVYSGVGVSNGTFNPTIAGIGTHTITYSYTNSGLCSATATQTIVVNALPIVSFTGLPNSLCENDNSMNYPLIGSPVGGTFSGSGMIGNVFNKSNITLGSGTYDIIYHYTHSTGCTNADTQSVWIQAAPVANAGLDDSVAYNNSYQLGGSASGGSGNYTYSWSPSNLLMSTAVSNPTTVALLLDQEFVLQIVDSQTQCSDTDHVMITVTGGPLTAQLTSLDNPICIGQSSQLNAVVNGGTGNYSYTWSSTPAGFTSSIGNPVVTPNVTTTYQVTVNDGVSSQVVSLSIQVNTIPNVSLNSFPHLCEGSPSLTLSGGSPIGGVYSGVGVSNGAFDPVVSGAGIHTLTYTYTSTNGCSDSATAVIQVNAKPVVSYTNPVQVCMGQTAFQLTGGYPAGGNYSGSGVSNNEFDPSVAGMGAHTITYTVINGSGCMDSDTVLITVYSDPIVNAGSDQYMATNNSTTLIGSVTNGSGSFSYLWSPASALSTTNTATVNTATLTSSTVYTLSVMDDITMCTDSDHVTVTITGGNVVANVLPGHSSLCEGQSQTLLALGSGGNGLYSYQWSSNPVGFVSTQQNPVVSPTVTTTYQVQISSGASNDIASAVVTVHPVPNINIGNDTAICDGVPMTLDAGAGFSSYAWSDGSTAQTLWVNPNIMPDGLYNYSVTVSTGGACFASDSIEIGIGYFPYINLGADITMCNDQTQIIDAGFGFTSYLWSTGDTTQYIMADSNLFPVGWNEVWVQVGNQTSCTSKDTLMLLMENCVGITEIVESNKTRVYPNPNNGEFVIELDNYPADDYLLEIFNANGQLVYKETLTVALKQERFYQKLKGMANGVYQLKIQGKQLVESKMIIIQ